MKKLTMIAVDLGAGSGRTIAGRFDGSRLELVETHRFPNEPVMVNGSLYWDILRLFHEMKQGIIKAAGMGLCPDSIGIDTWGVDYGLLDENGDLLANPYHYRDLRTEGMMETGFEICPKKQMYERAGIQFMKFNTLYQLMAAKRKQPHLLEKAKTLLFIPDLLRYFLTGVKSTEYTIASTSQLLDVNTGEWDMDMMGRMGIPTDIFTEIVSACTRTGSVREDVLDELNIPSMEAIAVGGHDTASAVAAVPASGEDFAYISSGTWSLMGIESDLPIVNETTFNLNLTNEGGVTGNNRVLANIMGMWIIQECRRSWAREGISLNYDEINRLAEESWAFQCFIDPNDDSFFAPGDMPKRVQAYCEKTGQKVPESRGEIIRCVLESLALKYRMVAEELELVRGRKLDTIHVVGGGCRNRLLNQLTADCSGKTVLAGPVEATATGNIICQLIARGEVKDLSEARRLVWESFPVEVYKPENSDAWIDAWHLFCRLTGKE
ncbi:MAG TPA: rhamnulokinase [Thermoclostridium sp.]|nr:rhamnulokinase [Clostridiaceae bacterium]HOQ76268.1 rhamnulokinase [Thermoclostridium sp.]